MVNIRLENEAGKSVTEKVYLYKEQEELVDYINKKKYPSTIEVEGFIITNLLNFVKSC